MVLGGNATRCRLFGDHVHRMHQPKDVEANDGQQNVEPELSSESDTHEHAKRRQDDRQDDFQKVHFNSSRSVDLNGSEYLLCVRLVRFKRLF